MYNIIVYLKSNLGIINDYFSMDYTNIGMNLTENTDVNLKNI